MATNNNNKALNVPRFEISEVYGGVGDKTNK